MLIVGLNSDDWLVRKKGAAFMPWNERLCIINNLSMVDEVYTFDDDDGSAKHFIQQARAHYPNAELIFANGGDRTKDNIPEMDVVDANLSFVFGVGGENKMNSSSWILQEWKAPKTQRPWGYYRVLHQDGTEIKVKELTVNPGCSLSMQRHRYRHEHWFVTEGTATINTLDTDGNTVMNNFVMKNMQTYIGKEEWHQLVNKNHTPLKVIEIQFGEQCTEEDIERK
jgi:mannose-6-phosphate isomerase-like protein (cupin superfamily)